MRLNYFTFILVTAWLPAWSYGMYGAKDRLDDVCAIQGRLFSYQVSPRHFIHTSEDDILQVHRLGSLKAPSWLEVIGWQIRGVPLESDTGTQTLRILHQPSGVSKILSIDIRPKSCPGHKSQFCPPFTPRTEALFIFPDLAPPRQLSPLERVSLLHSVTSHLFLPISKAKISYLAKETKGGEHLILSQEPADTDLPNNAPLVAITLSCDANSEFAVTAIKGAYVLTTLFSPALPWVRRRRQISQPFNPQEIELIDTETVEILPTSSVAREPTLSMSATAAPLPILTMIPSFTDMMSSLSSSLSMSPTRSLPLVMTPSEPIPGPTTHFVSTMRPQVMTSSSVIIPTPTPISISSMVPNTTQPFSSSMVPNTTQPFSSSMVPNTTQVMTSSTISVFPTVTPTIITSMGPRAPMSSLSVPSMSFFIMPTSSLRPIIVPVSSFLPTNSSLVPVSSSMVHSSSSVPQVISSIPSVTSAIVPISSPRVPVATRLPILTSSMVQFTSVAPITSPIITSSVLSVASSLVPNVSSTIQVFGSMVPNLTSVVPFRSTMVPITSSLVPSTPPVVPITSSIVPITSLIAPITSSIVLFTSFIGPITSSIVPITSSIAPITSSIVPITSSIVPIISSIAPIASSIVPITSSIAPITSSIAPITSSIAPITSSIVPITSSIAPITSSIVPITSSIAPVTSSIVPITSPIVPVSSSISSEVPFTSTLVPMTSLIMQTPSLTQTVSNTTTMSSSQLPSTSSIIQMTSSVLSTTVMTSSLILSSEVSMVDSSTLITVPDMTSSIIPTSTAIVSSVIDMTPSTSVLTSIPISTTVTSSFIVPSSTIVPPTSPPVPTFSSPVLLAPLPLLTPPQGVLTRYTVPADTFFSNQSLPLTLELSALVGDVPDWLMLSNTSDGYQLAMIPPIGSGGSAFYVRLIATDLIGQQTADVISILPDTFTPPLHSILFTLATDIQAILSGGLQVLSDLSDRLESVFGTRVRILEISAGSTRIRFSILNIELVRNCQETELAVSRVLHSNGSYTQEFRAAFEPAYQLTTPVGGLGPCFEDLATIFSRPLPSLSPPESLKHLLLASLIPLTSLSMVLLIVLTLLCCCYRARRNSFTRAEKKAFHSRRPVVMEPDRVLPQKFRRATVLPGDLDIPEDEVPLLGAGRPPALPRPPEPTPPPPFHSLPPQ